MGQLFDQIREFVANCHQTRGSPDMERLRAIAFKHVERTVYWLQQLRPDADQALLIAAIAHDIERAIREEPEYQGSKIKEGGFAGEGFLREHQDKSAAIAAEFLEKQGATKEMVERVRALISRHEEGGDEDQNLLKDADSISHFEVSATFFVENIADEVGAEKVKEKFDWMYERITAREAREIAKPMYERAINSLRAMQGKG